MTLVPQGGGRRPRGREREEERVKDREKEKERTRELMKRKDIRERGYVIKTDNANKGETRNERKGKRGNMKVKQE